MGSSRSTVIKKGSSIVNVAKFASVGSTSINKSTFRINKSPSIIPFLKAKAFVAFDAELFTETATLVVPSISKYASKSDVICAIIAAIVVASSVS